MIGAIPTATVPALPGFRVVETLHVGSRSTVLRAVRRDDGLPVICKFLSGDDIGGEDKAAFQREFAITRRLRHAGIVEALDCVPHGNGLMMVFRDIGGTALDALPDVRTEDVAVFLRMALQAVDALAAVHDAGVVHKDISPGNLIWNPATGQFNLIDFGIASELSREEAGDPDVGTMEGTLAYMAPEQTGRMNRSVDYRADFYALGATFHDVLTGQPPFPSGDPLELVHCHIARTPVPVHKLNPLVPEPLSAIVARLMAKNPEERYQSAFGLRADLERCLTEWRSHGRVESFALASRDVRPVLRIPQKLYGRTAQFRVLLDAFGRAAASGFEALLISGYSGVGKSALVRELHKPVIARHGFFITGKFEPLKRDIPYAPVIEAFKTLVRQTFAAGPDSLARWRARLLAALGPNGRVITDVIPHVERLIGPQPPVPELGPVEAHERFIYVFRNFVRAFAGAGHPLVLFLDDLQWADLATLKLLEGLAGDPELGHFLLVGTCRDTEVDALHPLRHTIQTFGERGVPVRDVSLGGLDADAVVALLSDTLHAAPDDVRPLAERLIANTLGNPFFLGQFLESLEQGGLIAYDGLAGVWNWNLEAIESQRMERMVDDVVTFVVRRIRELPAETLAVVQTAACIGSAFDLATLADASRRTSAATAAALWPALRSGLVVPVGDAYRYADMDSVSPRATYRFVHDRVQQAAYSMLRDADALACHLAVGLVLERGGNASGDRAADRLFAITNQLNRAVTLLSPEQRERLAHYNLLAGQAARASAALGPAFDYLITGVGLLPADGWSRLYELALSLHAEAAEIAAVNGDVAAATPLAAAIEANARTVLDRALAYETQIQMHVSRQNLPAALAACRTALGQLGSPIPERADTRHVLKELATTKLALRGKGEEDLVNRPPLTDPRLLTIGRIVSRVLASAYLHDTNLYTVLLLRMVRLSATEGILPASGITYATYGLLHCAMLGDVPAGAMYGRVALRVLDRLNANQGRAQTLFVVHLFIEVWHQPVAKSLAGLLDAHRIGLETGDIEYAAYCLNNAVAQGLFLGHPLRQLQQTAAGHAAAIARLNQQTAAGVLRPHQQLIANLLGESEDPTVFAGPHVTEASDVPALAASGNRLALDTMHSHLAYLNLLFGRIDEARRCMAKRRPFADASMGMVMNLRMRVVAALIDFAAWDRLRPAERLRARAAALGLERRLRGAVRHAPTNFRHLLALVVAERLRATGRLDKAHRHYQTAAESAREQGFTHDEAFACERAGEAALARGDRFTAKAMLFQARHAYRRWDALAKVRALDARLAELFGETAADQGPVDDGFPPQRPVTASSRRRSSSGSSSHMVDVETVIRTSRALAQDIRLGDLLWTLMKLVITNAGATRGCLLLPTDGAWRIEADATSEGDAAEVLQSRPLDDAAPVLVRGVVDAVIQTGEPVVLADAANDGDFQYDAYTRLAQPRSVLCLPLRNRNQMVGILYLENNLAADIFSPERLELLDLLSVQIAISIENARLYDGLERLNRTLEAQVAERTREVAEQSQLLRATLASMYDGLAAFDAEERLRVWNERAMALFSLPDTLRRVGVPYRELSAAVNASGQLLTALVPSPLVSSPSEIEFADGRVIQVRSNPMPDGGMVQVYVDVTVDRSRENELRDAHEQLHATHAQLKAAQQQLVQAEKMASLGQLVAGVAHEINTPIGIVMTSASYLGEKISALETLSDTGKMRRADFQDFMQAARDAATLMISNATRAADLVQSFKQVASDQTRSDRRRFDLHGYLEEVLVSLRPTWHRPGHEVRLECPKGIELDSYPGVIAQIVTNLITNSVNHAYREGEKGRIAITAQTLENDGVRLVYQDDGCGIPVENHIKVFEPFFTTRRGTGSTGLGLHIVFNLVTSQLGGTIQLDSRPGEGTRFTVEFPCRAPGKTPQS
ncbi:trifunctional serine/threonine-protein kinase/ATP-binding protein/sensor histidine kinase [Azospirillum himalayense]|uniref:histidine kinase n=1 Tax=Azospirillum himalayense TaxID=654847 RepID=A0ABW0G040_9PROT